MSGLSDYCTVHNQNVLLTPRVGTGHAVHLTTGITLCGRDTNAGKNWSYGSRRLDRSSVNCKRCKSKIAEMETAS